jgi:hypothetical protein
MSNSINRFIDKVRAADSRQQKEESLSLQEARDLHNDITRLLLKLEAAAAEPQPVVVEFKGQDF